MFSDATKAAAFTRSGGYCECRRQAHGHTGRCNAALTRGNVEYHHITAQSVGGGDGLSNCEVLCSRCHRQTASYGRS